MAVVVNCEDCGAKLKVPEERLGRKVKCPRCQAVFVAADTAVASTPPPRPPAAPTSKRAREEEDRGEGYEEVHDDEDEAPPGPPKRRKSRPVKEDTFDEAITEEEPQRSRASDDDDEERDRPRKKKRKKKRRQEVDKYPSAAEGWHWWAAACAVLLSLTVLTAILGFAGMVKPNLHLISVWILIDVPFSAVVLIGSMFLSSFIAGGIEFGDARIVIPKALVLLTFISPFYLLPFGNWLALPIWMGALMYLFRLDLWECQLLVAVNWALNWLAAFLLIGALAAALGAAEKASSQGGGLPQQGAPAGGPMFDPDDDGP